MYVLFNLICICYLVMVVTHPCRLASLPSSRRQRCHSTVTLGQ